MKRIKLFPLIFISCFFHPISNDIQVTKNENPQLGEFTLNTEFVLSLKESNNDYKYMFDKIQDIALDSNGNIYLIDSNRVVKYSCEGKFINEIGRKGQGPGEFISPLKLFLNESDQLYINDQGKIIVVYNKDGQFIRNIKLNFLIPSFPVSARKFYIDKKGNIFAMTRKYAESGIRMELIKSDRNGKVIKSLCYFNENEVKFKINGGGGVAGGIFHPYSQNCYFQVILDSYLVFSHNMEYKFTIYNMEGEIISIFTLSDIPQLISKKEQNLLGKNLKFPPYRPFFSDILSDGKGRIYVIRSKSITDRTKEVNIDIFSKSGQYMYKSKLPFQPKLIKNNLIITVENDESDLRNIKIFSIKNYNKLHEIN